MTRKKHQEDNEQESFFRWIKTCTFRKKPLFKFCFAIPNGGKRNLREAARFKKQGVLAGVSDVFLTIPKHGFHGLYIEMKHGDNKLSKNQQEFKENVTMVNYLHVTCYSWRDAKEEVELYLSDVGGTPKAYIEEVDKPHKYRAVCRRMSKDFKTRNGAVGWLRRRGFDEMGRRV